MSGDQKMLFVRESSGLVKEVGTGFAVLLPIALTLGPWFHYGGVYISTWYPGAHIFEMFAIGSFTVFFEALALMCLMLSMPRSGASYYFTGRGLSPIFGVMEGWRSVITNPVFRGTGSFFAVQVFAGGLTVVGASNPAIATMAATLLQPIPLCIAAIAMILVGFVFSYMSVKWLGWFVIILGLINILALTVADITMLMTPNSQLSTIWDTVFGAGTYANVVTAGGNIVTPVDYTTFSWGAVGPALILTVGMMWPYLIMPVAGEVAQPSKNIPLSNVGGWAGIAFFFLLSAFALESMMGTFLYSNNIAAYTATTGSVFPGFGNFAAVVLAAQNSPLVWFVVLCPIYASVLDSPSNALWVTRPFHSMAMDRFCPAAFANVHPKYHVPHVSLWFWLILTIATTIYATILQVITGTGLSALVGVGFTYVFIRWQMALAAVSLPYYRPTLWERSGAWKVPGLKIPLISFGGLISGAVFFYAMIAFQATAVYEIMFTVIVYVWGQIMYLYYGAKNKAKGIELGAIFGQLPPE